MDHSLIRMALAAVRRAPRLLRSIPQAWRLYQRNSWPGFKLEVRRRLDPVGYYARWVQRYGTLTPQERQALRARAAAMESPPLIAVLMPTFNPDPRWFMAAVESVRSQLYPHWQLCIADDASTSAHARELLERCAASDSRIRVVFRSANGHISAASNSALELVTAPWVALMDHDDLLSEDALLRVAECIQAHPEARLIYSDEDKVDAAGRRFHPYFKPDWNVDLFRSQNMFSHLGVLSSDLVRSVGGFRVGLEGSQDWDLVLRCSERVRPEQIRHIPRVLYHWRVHRQSTASSMKAKPYAAQAGERALNEHFQRLGVAAQAQFLGHGYRTRYALPAALPLVSIIIPTRNAHALVRRCIESIRSRTHYPRYEILLVDNGSDDAQALAYFGQLAQQPDVRVLRDARPFNYAALNNAAAAQARGELLALVNNDIEVITPDWLGEMVSIALQPGVGAVGARLWYPDKTLQHGGVILGPGGGAVHAHRFLPQGLVGEHGRGVLMQSFSAVTAACLVVRRTLYEQMAGLDEQLAVAYNDVDFCLRLREAGYRNVWTPYAELLHHESATRGEDMTPPKRERFARELELLRQRWQPLIDHDPAYNPNLTRASEDFGLAWPPRQARP